MSFPKSSSFHYKIACLGLFAILLITFGPVISQVQAMLLLNSSEATHNMSHHQSMAQQTTIKANHLSTTDKQKIQTTSTSHHFMSLCGYCDLVHHSPIIAIYLPLTIAESPPQQIISPLYLIDYRSPSYCKALSRAPPFKLINTITS